VIRGMQWQPAIRQIPLGFKINMLTGRRDYLAGEFSCMIVTDDASDLDCRY